VNDAVISLALRRAHHAGETNLFRLTAHAMQRMMERDVSRGDIASALRSATSAIAQPGDRWRLEGGADLAGDPLTIVAALRSGVVVVTMF
jgi:hypothetical protein